MWRGRLPVARSANERGANKSKCNERLLDRMTCTHHRQHARGRERAGAGTQGQLSCHSKQAARGMHGCRPRAFKAAAGGLGPHLARLQRGCRAKMRTVCCARSGHGLCAPLKITSRGNTRSRFTANTYHALTNRTRAGRLIAGAQCRNVDAVSRVLEAL